MLLMSDDVNKQMSLYAYIDLIWAFQANITEARLWSASLRMDTGLQQERLYADLAVQTIWTFTGSIDQPAA
jgi:hypothetical protein